MKENVDMINLSSNSLPILTNPNTFSSRLAISKSLQVEMLDPATISDCYGRMCLPLEINTYVGKCRCKQLFS